MNCYTLVSESVFLTENGYHVTDENGDNIGHIEVRPNEGGGKKHYHITCDKMGGKICVLMDKLEYYIHDVWRNKFMNKKAAQLFNDYLDSDYTDPKSKKTKTRWEWFKYDWNRAHAYQPKYTRIPDDFEHPDYTELFM